MYHSMGIPTSGHNLTSIEMVLGVISDNMISKPSSIVFDYTKKGNFEEGKDKAYEVVGFGALYTMELLKISEKYIVEEFGLNNMFVSLKWDKSLRE